jgi:cytochrome c556
MRLRALALALVLSFGLTASMEARPKPAVQRSKAMKKAAKRARKASKKAAKRASKQSRATRVKQRKAAKRRV